MVAAQQFYNIAISAGGTSEDMDGVRKLTNVSTGSLGWSCLKVTLDYFLSEGNNNFHIYYIHTHTAYWEELTKEQNKQVSLISVTDAKSVYKAIDKLTKEVDITHFIHSMAISDFTFSYAVSMDNLAEELFASFRQESEITVEKIEKILSSPDSKNREGTKLSSSKPMLIGLERTQKVIPLIKQNNKNTVLVGFKLLSNVTESELLDVAVNLLHKNSCNYVFANELSRISGDEHAGILINGSGIVARPKGKREIARTIVETMLQNN